MAKNDSSFGISVPRDTSDTQISCQTEPVKMDYRSSKHRTSIVGTLAQERIGRITVDIETTAPLEDGILRESLN